MYIESFLNENRGSLDSNILEFIQVYIRMYVQYVQCIHTCR